MLTLSLFVFFVFKQKTAYEMRISDWSSDVCSSDLLARVGRWYLAPLVPGLATFLAGTAVASGLANPIGFAAVVALPALLFAGVWLLNCRAAAMLRDRIARIDADSPFDGDNGSPAS